MSKDANVQDIHERKEITLKKREAFKPKNRVHFTGHIVTYLKQDEQATTETCRREIDGNEWHQEASRGSKGQCKVQRKTNE